MTDLLRPFQGDFSTKEQLIDFIHDYIDTTALDRMYKGEDVSHIKDAKKLIDGAFEELDNIYSLPRKEYAPTNDAR